MRKKTPLVFPCRPSSVNVGDDEAGETCTTWAGAVTEVRIGIDTEEMMPPMMTGTFLTWTSWVAASTATLPWLWESRVSVTSLQPPSTPPASLMSRNAISTDLAPAWPYSPAGPVSSMTRPTVTSQSAIAAPAPTSKAAAAVAVNRIFFPNIEAPLNPVGLCDGLQPGLLQMNPGHADGRFRRTL